MRCKTCESDEDNPCRVILGCPAVTDLRVKYPEIHRGMRLTSLLEENRLPDFRTFCNAMLERRAGVYRAGSHAKKTATIVSLPQKKS